MWFSFTRKPNVAASHRTRQSSCRPRLEALEDRWCPSGGTLDWSEALPTSALFSASATAVQADGKIVLVGSSQSGIAVARLNADGTLDTTFNNTGSMGFRVNNWGGTAGTAVAIQSNGQIVVGAYAHVPNTVSNTEAVVARINSDGTLDRRFGKKGYFVYSAASDSSVNSVAILANGMIVAGGYRRTSAGPAQFLALELTASGNLNTAFGSGGVAAVQVGAGSIAYSMAVVPNNGQIVLAGYTSVQAVDHPCIVTFTASGQVDSTFNGIGTLIAVDSPLPAFRSVVIQGSVASGFNIVVAGFWASGSSPDNALTAVTRYTLTGSLDTSFGGMSTGSFTLTGGHYLASLALLADGSLILSGSQRYIGGDGSLHDRMAVTHLSMDGMLDTSFGPNGTGISYAQIGINCKSFRGLAIDPLSGDIIVAGFTGDTLGQSKAVALARFTRR